MTTDFGLFNETSGFNKERMVKQFGGETARLTVENCIDNNPIGDPTIDKSVQKVMTCLEDGGLKLYRDKE